MGSPCAAAASTRRLLLVFTKPARPGRVKTRLIGALSAEQAAALHAAFLADLAAELAPGAFTLRFAWALEPGEAMPATPGPGEVQRGSDLGERLHAALAGAAAAGFGAVAVVGSDHPDLGRERVEEAFAAVEAGADVAFGPADDGGYYLVAGRREAWRRELFAGIPWSTGAVLAASLARCRELGLEVALLAPESDVDTPADLARLARRLARRPERCPQTRRLLAAWGRLASERPGGGGGAAVAERAP